MRKKSCTNPHFLLLFLLIREANSTNIKERCFIHSATRVPARALKMLGKSVKSLPTLQQCRLQHTDDRSVVKVLNMESDAGLMVDAFSQVRHFIRLVFVWNLVLPMSGGSPKSVKARFDRTRLPLKF